MHPDPTSQSSLATALHDLANIAIQDEKYEEARALLERAVVTQKSALKETPDSSVFQQRLQNHQTALAQLPAGRWAIDPSLWISITSSQDLGFPVIHPDFFLPTTAADSARRGVLTPRSIAGSRIHTFFCWQNSDTTAKLLADTTGTPSRMVSRRTRQCR